MTSADAMINPPINRKAQRPVEKTYRFWVTHNGGPVRLRLKVGQSIDLHSGGPTEEGYRWASHAYYIDREKGVMIGEHSWEARDCDGRMSGGGDNWAYLSELAVRELYAGSLSALERQEAKARRVRYPEWHPLNSWQSDHQAEAAGF
jgi:hypothetical protein